MKPVTRVDLENAITEAQYRVAMHNLRNSKCPVCAAEKGYNHPLCRRCWFALPEENRKPLCLTRDTPANVEIFTAAYLSANNLLREMGFGDFAA